MKVKFKFQCGAAAHPGVGDIKDLTMEMEVEASPEEVRAYVDGLLQTAKNMNTLFLGAEEAPA